MLSGRISVSLNITLFLCIMSQISLNRCEPGVALKSLSMHTDTLHGIQECKYTKTHDYYIPHTLHDKLLGNRH